MIQLFNYFKVLRDFMKCKKFNRQQLLEFQKQKFKIMLKHAYTHSEFYKDYYSSHGIKESDLEDISVEDLPFTEKSIITDNLDKVFTHKELKKEDIERWLEINHNPADLYQKHYVIVHTSGSSGKTGIFVYHKNDWTYATSLAGMRFFSLLDFMTGKYVFFAATHGHFTGASIDAISMINTRQRLKMISILDPIDDVIERINEFNPTKLIGYPSAICILAKLSLANKLRIHPQMIIVSGELSTNPLVDTIKKAFGIDPCNFYITSETLVMGAQRTLRDNLILWDDLNLIEMIEEEESETEPKDKTGRVVVTNLFNQTTPLIRYKTDDRLVLNPEFGLDPHFAQFTQVKSICGRVLDPLPIITDTGDKDYIHPIVLVEFFIKDAQRFQFESSSPNIVTIYYESTKNLDASILSEFNKLLLQRKAANGTKVIVKNVDLISIDKSGKSKLIKIK